MKTEESGVSHAAVMVEADMLYNLITTDPNQAFSAYLYSTFQRIQQYRYTKGVNIGYEGTFMSHDYFPIILGKCIINYLKVFCQYYN